VPVVNADSATFADVTVAMGSRTVGVRLSIKLITATAAVMAPAAAKILILRITLSSTANSVVHNQHDQLRSVNIWFERVRAEAPGSPA
jgi:acetyl-CoA carboxylase carboxyltransferase component